jgi:chromosome segregation ATPase
MPPDPTPLAAAARRKRGRAQARARSALRELDQQGGAITFQSVARHAGASRQWLYTQPDLRREIDRLRQQRTPARQAVPASERATQASLHQRVELLLEENRRLRAEIKELKTELAFTYGRRRDAP